MFILIVIFFFLFSCSNPVMIEDNNPTPEIDYIECEVKCSNPLSKFTQDGAKGWCTIADTNNIFKFYPYQIPITLYSKSFVYNEKFNLYFVISRDTFTVARDTAWDVKCEKDSLGHEQ